MADNDTLKYSIEQFDKSVLFIASGALGISFSFIDKFVPDFSKAQDTDKLFNAWYIFGSVIFLFLSNHFISMLANTWAVKNDNLSDEEFNNKIAGWNWSIRVINAVMVVLLLIGVICLIQFVELNINPKNE